MVFKQDFLILTTNTIHTYLQIVEREYGEGQTAPEVFRTFLKDLASFSPVCGLFVADQETKALLDLIKESDIRKDALNLAKLQEKVPFIFNLIGRLPSNGKYTLPNDFNPLIDALWKKASWAPGSDSSQSLSFLQSTYRM
jgi:hypothetical protein